MFGMRNMMITHRFFVLAAWSALLLTLLIYPGFEVKGLAFGTIIGYWPFAFWGELGDGITLLSMLALSAIEVWLCAWVMDRANLTKKAWGVLLFSILAGAATIYALDDYDFEDWVGSPAVSAAMESPEVHYEPARRDFNREIVIPKVLAGGMLGLYAATAMCFLSSVALILSRNRRLRSRLRTAAQSRHESRDI